MSPYRIRPIGAHSRGLVDERTSRAVLVAAGFNSFKDALDPFDANGRHVPRSNLT